MRGRFHPGRKTDEERELLRDGSQCAAVLAQVVPDSHIGVSTAVDAVVVVAAFAGVTRHRCSHQSSRSSVECRPVFGMTSWGGMLW